MKLKNVLFTSVLVLSVPALVLSQGAGERVVDAYEVVEKDLVQVEGEIETLIEDGTLEKGSDESETVVSILSEIQDLLIANNVEVDTSKLDELKDSMGGTTDGQTVADSSDSSTGSESASSGSSTGSAPSMPKYYVVKKRTPLTDCLWRIAGYSFIYDNPSRWTLIYEANKGIIKDADLIYPGQVIEIPSSDGEERSGTYDI